MCSYCGCESIEVVGRFMAEHVEIVNTSGTLGRACAGHDAALARIRAGDHASYPSFDGAPRLHIDREENGLFPAAAVAFAGPEWEQVAALTPATAQP